MDVTDNTSSVFSVNKPEAVECAVPYKDGILYTTNVLNDPETDSISYDWQLIYNDGSEETIVDSNINYGSGPKPYLTLIDGTPVYVFTASTQTYSDATFVMKLSGMEPEKVDERVDLIADTIGMATDGKHIAFQLFPNTEEDYTAVVSVYSTDRLVMEIENRTTDYEQIGINDNMLFRISASESDPQLASVGVTDINTGEVLFTIDGDKALYFPVRLNDTLTAVYGSDNRIYAIDSETESLRICETPSSVFGGTTVMQTMGDERILFQQGRGKFYVMSVNGQ